MSLHVSWFPLLSQSSDHIDLTLWTELNLKQHTECQNCPQCGWQIHSKWAKEAVPYFGDAFQCATEVNFPAQTWGRYFSEAYVVLKSQTESPCSCFQKLLWFRVLLEWNSENTKQYFRSPSFFLYPTSLLWHIKWAETEQRQLLSSDILFILNLGNK